MIVFDGARDFLEILTRHLRREGDRRSDEDVLRPFLLSLRRGHERSIALARLDDYAARSAMNRDEARPNPYAGSRAPIRGPTIPVPHARSKPLAVTGYKRGWAVKVASHENQNKPMRAKLEVVT